MNRSIIKPPTNNMVLSGAYLSARFLIKYANALQVKKMPQSELPERRRRESGYDEEKVFLLDFSWHIQDGFGCIDSSKDAFCKAQKLIKVLLLGGWFS